MKIDQQIKVFFISKMNFEKDFCTVKGIDDHENAYFGKHLLDHTDLLSFVSFLCPLGLCLSVQWCGVVWCGVQ